MANQLKGEFKLAVQPEEEGGPMGSLTLVYDWDALCAFEDFMGLGLIDCMVMMGRGFRLKLVRGLFWAGLRAKHPEIDLAGADALIRRCGGPFDLFGKLGDGFKQAFPQAEAGGDAALDPPKAAAEVAAAGTPATASASGSSTD